jgi:DNA-binding FadR family transcriptional regulator
MCAYPYKQKTDQEMILSGPATISSTGSNRPRRELQNLTFSIVEMLGKAIVTEHYSARNPIATEAVLCAEFGVSRSIMREAVKMLTAKGLLWARPRQGTFVCTEDRWNMLDPDVLRWLLDRKVSLDLLIEFSEIRLAVEPAAAALAARFASPEDKEAIASAIARMDAAARGEEDALASDIAFHIAVLDASGNRFYRQLRELIETALRFSIGITNNLKGVKYADANQHKRCADAIIAGDEVGARAEMASMLNEMLELISKANGGVRARSS